MPIYQEICIALSFTKVLSIDKGEMEFLREGIWKDQKHQIVLKIQQYVPLTICLLGPKSSAKLLYYWYLR